MNIRSLAKHIWLPSVMFALFLVAIACRPLLPVDETRYMTVAWEMFLRQGWFQPLTVNFEPYHHKPPLLFWLINLSWSIFGVSRWAGLIPVVGGSLACVYLTSFLGKKIFPNDYNAQRIYIIMVASLPFLTYSTLVMFDLLLTVFVLLSLLCLHSFYKDGRLRYAVLMGLFLGLGVLTKGPVAYLYVLPVALLAPFWGINNPIGKNWYWGLGLSVLVSLILVLLWVIPVIHAADNNFAFWLIWNQTAGRVTGNFNASHVRPFWFYLPLIPFFFMPWALLPRFWKGWNGIKEQFRSNEGLRFLLSWAVPVIIAFSFISGKQPHYLVPLIPAIALYVSYHLRALPVKSLVQFSGIILTLFISGQIIAGQTILKKYKLEPLAEIIKIYPNRDLAFVSNYHGEMGFLGERSSPIEDVELGELDKWFDKHPDGWAIIKFREDESDIKKYRKIYSSPYRSRNIGLFKSSILLQR